MLNAKGLKFLELFEALLKIDIELDKIACAKAVRNLLDLDYAAAADVWEYLASTREAQFEQNERLSETVGFDLLNQFYARAASKCVKTLLDTPPIRRAVFLYSKNACAENSLTMLADLLIAGKFTAADEIFKCLLKNARVHYGKTVKNVVERVFADLLKKNPAKIVMKKDLAEFLLACIRKIKTDERALLEQRIKEIMR